MLLWISHLYCVVCFRSSTSFASKRSGILCTTETRRTARRGYQTATPTADSATGTAGVASPSPPCTSNALCTPMASRFASHRAGSLAVGYHIHVWINSVLFYAKDLSLDAERRRIRCAWALTARGPWCKWFKPHTNNNITNEIMYYCKGILIKTVLFCRRCLWCCDISTNIVHNDNVLFH